MFTVKEIDNKLVLDIDQPHSTMERHFFNQRKDDLCSACSEKLEGTCTIKFISKNDEPPDVQISHEECPNG